MPKNTDENAVKTAKIIDENAVKIAKIIDENAEKQLDKMAEYINLMEDMKNH